MPVPTDNALREIIADLAPDKPDEAARLLRRLPRDGRPAIVAALPQAQQREVLALAEQPVGTAGAMMTSRYASLAGDMRADAAIAMLTADAAAESIYTAFVVDEAGRLVGQVFLRTLMRAPPDATVAALMTGHPRAVETGTPDETAARLLVGDNARALAVVDDAGVLVGMITQDDAQQCLLAAIDDDRAKFAALAGEPAKDDYLDVSLLADFRRRAPWILVLAVAGLMAGYVVHIYEDALDALVLLALYMPMVADTGGNVGTQSASLVLRAVATGELQLRQTGLVLWRETRVGLALAAMLFLFAYLKVWLMSNHADLGPGMNLQDVAIAVGLAIATCVFVATLIGAVLPMGALLLRADPAVVAGPALTTIVDVIGLLLYFTITTWWLELEIAITP